MIELKPVYGDEQTSTRKVLLTPIALACLAHAQGVPLHPQVAAKVPHKALVKLGFAERTDLDEQALARAAAKREKRAAKRRPT